MSVFLDPQQNRWRLRPSTARQVDYQVATLQVLADIANTLREIRDRLAASEIQEKK